MVVAVVPLVVEVDVAADPPLPQPEIARAIKHTGRSTKSAETSSGYHGCVHRRGSFVAGLQNPLVKPFDTSSNY
jgi:hypothetical protein